MSVVIASARLEAARRRKQARDEQAFIEACEREADLRPGDMDELIRRAKARVEREGGR